MIITACTTESSLETLGSNLSTLIIFDLDLATPSTVFRTANMHPFTAYALGAAFLGLVVYAAIEAFTKYDKRYNVQNMPGPWLVPWVGRIHDLPIEFMWLKFQEWANTYGPIYRTKMLGANFVVITDEKIAGICSSRRPSCIPTVRRSSPCSMRRAHTDPWSTFLSWGKTVS